MVGFAAVLIFTSIYFSTNAQSTNSEKSNSVDSLVTKINVLTDIQHQMSTTIDKLNSRLTALENTVLEKEREIMPSMPAECAFARDPDSSMNDTAHSATRFGVTDTSRWEFDAVPGGFRLNSEFSLEFKTDAYEGLLFFASEGVDFITLYMENGRLHYGFNCGSGRVVIRSDCTYNDDQWHRVQFIRLNRQGTLKVGIEIKRGETPGPTRALNVNPPFYVGGVGGDGLYDIIGIVPAGITTFTGCIKNLHLNGIQIDSPDRECSTQTCTAT